MLFAVTWIQTYKNSCKISSSSSFCKYFVYTRQIVLTYLQNYPSHNPKRGLPLPLFPTTQDKHLLPKRRNKCFFAEKTIKKLPKPLRQRKFLYMYQSYKIHIIQVDIFYKALLHKGNHFCSWSSSLGRFQIHIRFSNKIAMRANPQRLRSEFIFFLYAHAD